MERKKTKVIELPDLEMDILRHCIFPESFEAICEECQGDYRESVVADAIKNLIHHKLLVADNESNSLTWIYDSDRMRDSRFKATADGVEWMEENGVG